MNVFDMTVKSFLFETARSPEPRMSKRCIYRTGCARQLRSPILRNLTT